jgi:hypothetical protein
VACWNCIAGPALTPGPSPSRTPRPPGEGSVQTFSYLPIYRRFRFPKAERRMAQALKITALPSPGGAGVRLGEGPGVRAAGGQRAPGRVQRLAGRVRRGAGSGTRLGSAYSEPRDAYGSPRDAYKGPRDASREERDRERCWVPRPAGCGTRTTARGMGTARRGIGNAVGFRVRRAAGRVQRPAGRVPRGAGSGTRPGSAYGELRDASGEPRDAYDGPRTVQGQAFCLPLVTVGILYGSWTGAIQISSLALLRRSVHVGKNLPAYPERLL